MFVDHRLVGGLSAFLCGALGQGYGSIENGTDEQDGLGQCIALEAGLLAVIPPAELAIPPRTARAVRQLEKVEPI